MTTNNTQNFQWFIITAKNGNEDSIIESLKDKIINFQFTEFVNDIKVFKTTTVVEEILKKADPELPKTFRNTKTTKWEVLADGSYKKTKTKTSNKFPGYIFINMMMDQNIWYCIRNTTGVFGFVGSSGKGATPIPVSISEYENISGTNKVVEETMPQTLSQESKDVSTPTEQERVIHHCNYKVGNTVSIASGAFDGECGVIKSLDNIKGLVSIEIEMFGRTTIVEVPYAEIKDKE